MTSTTPPSPTIVVIGAGVIGLSAATLLQSHLPASSICLIASEFPSSPCHSASYASMWAGAHYRPIPASSPQLKAEMEMSWQTAKAMKEIARTNPESGVKEMPGIEYLEEPPKGYLVLKTGDIYAGIDDGFRVLEARELPERVKWGCEYGAYCVNVLVYCTWLLSRFCERGGKVVERKLRRVEDVFEIEGFGKVETIVNCSGNNFGVDPKMKVIRGQTVLVKNEYHRTVTRQNSDGSWAFLIPRPRGGGTIVGGSKEIGDMEELPREETRRRLLAASIKYFPDFISSLEDFEVLRDNVGRRPWRDGGLRVEMELLQDGTRIVHGYGAGGRGYELSWAVAEELLALVKVLSSSVPDTLTGTAVTAQDSSLLANRLITSICRRLPN